MIYEKAGTMRINVQDVRNHAKCAEQAVQGVKVA